MALPSSSSSLPGCWFSEDREQAVGYRPHHRYFVDKAILFSSCTAYTWRKRGTGWRVCTCLRRRANQSYDLKDAWIQTLPLPQTLRWKSIGHRQLPGAHSANGGHCPFLTGKRVSSLKRLLRPPKCSHFQESSSIWRLKPSVNTSVWRWLGTRGSESSPLQQWEKTLKKWCRSHSRLTPSLPYNPIWVCATQFGTWTEGTGGNG